MVSRAGFTLIELLTTLAILAIAGTVGFLTLTNYSSGDNLKLSVNEVVAVVRDAEHRAINQQNGVAWGTLFVNTNSAQQFKTFSGTSSFSGVISGVNSLRNGVVFSAPYPSSTSETDFSAISGTLSSGINQIISLVTKRGDGLVGDIIVSANGLITSRIDSGVNGYWHFDESPATTTIYDASGWGNKGLLMNGLLQSSSTCVAGGCLSFDGINDRAEASSSISFGSGTNNIKSISFWFKKSVFSSKAIVATCENASFLGTNHQLDLGVDLSGKASFVTYDGTVDTLLGIRSNLFDGLWHYVVGVIAPAGKLLYVDGVLDNSNAKVVSLNQQTTLRFGNGAGQGQGANFDGSLDEVKFYNRALSASDIALLYSDLR